jgi:hypothetical protein
LEATGQVPDGEESKSRDGDAAAEDLAASD